MRMAANVLSGEVAFELVVHLVDHTVQEKEHRMWVTTLGFWVLDRR